MRSFLYELPVHPTARETTGHCGPINSEFHDNRFCSDTSLGLFLMERGPGDPCMKGLGGMDRVELFCSVGWACSSADDAARWSETEQVIHHDARGRLESCVR